MYKLLGRSTSGNVQKVMWLLNELGVDYVREDYGRQFENTGGDYLTLNPTGKVPTLVEDGNIIWESNTILRYICRREQSTFIPADPAEQASMETWMDWQLASLNGPYLDVFKASRKPEEERGSAFKDMAMALVSQLQILDGRLAGNIWASGEKFSLAEFCLGPIVHRCLNFPIELPPLDHLQDWHERLMEQDHFIEVVGPKPVTG